MGKSRDGSVGSYSSGNSGGVGNVLGKYGANDTDGKIAKMEKDISNADKIARKKQEKLRQTAAATKAQELSSLAKNSDGAGGGGDDSDDQSGSGVDGSEKSKGKAVEAMLADLTKRTPEEVFKQFDTDGSGLIDFDEFRAMLPQLGIKISMPKALKYFRTCDPDGSGEIDIEEFKVAMFAMDPDSGNPVGFTPNALLTPLDAFEMFDEDNSGQIDEDEFFFLLQYLGLEVSEVKQEQMFSKYDADKSGYIEYAEFKKIWVRLANVKKELLDRGVKIPKLATKVMLSNLLEQILDTEEDRERRAIAEAERWAKWQMLLKDKRRAYEKARRRSMTELKSALDAAGSVWVFGTGPFGEFKEPAPKTLTQGEHEFAHYDVIRGVWTTRVDPPPTAPPPITLGIKHARRRRKEKGVGGSSSLDSDGNIASSKDADPTFEGVENEVSTDNQDNHLDPEEEARSSPFADLCVAQSTAALWGRRIVSVTTTDSAAFAVSEQGEGYAWGGKNHWWFEIRPDSHWQTHWRGDTTERSRLLLQTLHKEEPSEIEPDEEEDEAEKEIEKLRTLTMYFGVWKPPPTNHTLHFINHDLLPKIRHPEVKYSLQCRGKHVEDMNKTELLDLLYDDIVLEKKVLGERQHRRIRQLELETLNMYEKGKNVMGKSLRLEIEEMWTPLREIQAEDKAIQEANARAGLGTEYARKEHLYSQWREYIRQARDDAKPAFTPRGNSLEIGLGGITERAGPSRTPRANDAAVAISAGANHVMLVHRSGQLYTWGVGASGRLGLDLSQGGNPQADAAAATVIQAFVGRPVIQASAAYSHSGAITAQGRVYTWGSAATGKLGLGTVDRDVYCSVPTMVQIDSKSKVKEISCGAAHTACATASGQLFVWGCGDGGRLGLGEERLGPQFEPILVEAFVEAEIRIGSVSCGNSHTLVLSTMREENEGVGGGRVKALKGGRMFQAGSTNVLGAFCPAFTPVSGLDELTVKQVSAGYGHSCCCTTAGELYTWGSNRDGCLGLPRSTKFANLPQLVSCLYVSPTNLAVGCPSRQSSVYDGLSAGVAVDGDRAGDHYRKCNCTQQDPQGWWEVDLGQLVHIREVKIWNRCDEPIDPSMERDFYAKRLFPCWVLASQEPFNEDVGGAALLDAINNAVARAQFKEECRCATWKCPDQTMARYVRVQLQGFNFLHMAQVEVYGRTGARRCPGRVTYCCAGKYVTAAVMAAMDDAADVETVYKKAVQADAFNADVLRELETFFSAYDQWGRGDAIKGCLLCKSGSLCEICSLKHEFRDELRDLPLAPGGGLQRLANIAQFLFDIEKPTLNYTTPVKKGAGIMNNIKGKITKLMASVNNDSIESGTRSSDTEPSESLVSSGYEKFGDKVGKSGRRRDSKNKKGNNRQRASPPNKKAATSRADTHTAGNGDQADKNSDSDAERANQEYHVGPLGGTLSSSRSSISNTGSTVSFESSAANSTGSNTDNTSYGSMESSAISSSVYSGSVSSSGDDATRSFRDQRGDGGQGTDRSNLTFTSSATSLSRTSGGSGGTGTTGNSGSVGGYVQKQKSPGSKMTSEKPPRSRGDATAKSENKKKLRVSVGG